MLTEEGKLIREVKRREFLYNNKLEDYNNPAKQAEAWTAIGRSLVLPASECKRMWEDLVRRFTAELRKREESFAREPAPKMQKVVPEDELEFLLPFVELGNENAANAAAANNDQEEPEDGEANGKGNPVVPPEKHSSTPTYRKRRHTFEEFGFHSKAEDSTDEESEESTESGSTDGESPDNKKRA